MIDTLIVDDQALVRAGFRAILDAEPDINVTGEAADGNEALELVRRVRPDIVLMDVRMPQMDGIEATRRIQRETNPPRVLVLTTFDLDEYVYEAIRAGASGFLLKDVPRDQLITGVRAVARGEALLAPAITQRLIERFVRQPAPQNRPPGALERLSAREIDVLRLLAQGLSNEEIAQRLFISRATVKTHVASILQKLTLRDRIQAVVLAYESGLIRPGSETEQAGVTSSK